MQSTSAIQHAHDTLVRVVLRQSPLVLGEYSEALMMESIRVLCWVLHESEVSEHAHVGDRSSAGFGTDLTALEEALYAHEHSGSQRGAVDPTRR